MLHNSSFIFALIVGAFVCAISAALPIFGTGAWLKRHAKVISGTFMALAITLGALGALQANRFERSSRAWNQALWCTIRILEAERKISAIQACEGRSVPERYDYLFTIPMAQGGLQDASLAEIAKWRGAEINNQRTLITEAEKQHVALRKAYLL